MRELGHKRLDVPHVAAVMRRLKAAGTNNDAPPQLSRDEFIAAAMQGRIADTSADIWVVWMRAQQARSEILSVAFQLLGLVHAPVAAKLFNYFDCQQVTPTHAFLVADYSLECGGDAPRVFVPFVLLLVMGFAVGLPLALSVVVFSNRKQLHTHELSRPRFCTTAITRAPSSGTFTSWCGV